MVNVEEIKSIVKTIETGPMIHHFLAEPGSPVWYQGDWVRGDPKPLETSEQARAMGYERTISVVDESCATACCVAGYAITRAGYSLGRGGAWDKDGNYIGSVIDVAADLLGLSGGQAMDVFSGSIGASGAPYVDKVGELKKVITKVTGITFDD